MLLALPDAIDSPKEFCYCGRKTIKSHEFLFCSTNCARRDSLRSLDDQNCHYRNVVRRAYVEAGVPELGPQPRRMASAVHLRPSHSERPRFENAPPLPQQSNADLAHIAPWTKFEKYVPVPAPPTYPSKGSSRTVTAGTPANQRHYQSRREDYVITPSRGHPILGPGGHAFQQPSLDTTPLPMPPLRRVTSVADGNNTKKSPVAALLNFGRSRKDKDAEAKKPEVVFDHPVNTDASAWKKEFRKGRYF